MKIELLAEEDKGNANASPVSPSSFNPDSECERLFAWAGLGAANVRKNLACIEQYQQRLRALGETDQRLNALHQWRQSLAFTEREKTALNLSEVISSKNPAEFSLATLKDARSHFSPEETIRLALTVMVVTDWIDFYEKRTETTFGEGCEANRGDFMAGIYPP